MGTDAEPTRVLHEYPAISWLSAIMASLEVGESLQRAGFVLPRIVHPAAWVSPTARLGAGTAVVGGAVLNGEVTLGRRCIINTGATVNHACLVGDDVNVSPGVHIGGGVTIGRRTWIGIGAAVRLGLTIGADVVGGAGAAVVENVGDGATVTGVPARSK
jgi:sugar O-acyltransferase (sialic acid O-acetyltransferase NeuD family)